MDSRGVFRAAWGQELIDAMSGGKEPVPGNARARHFQSLAPRQLRQGPDGDRFDMRQVIVKIKRERARPLSPRTGKEERLGMGRFKINLPARIEQSFHFLD